jgi:hypothetical protein
MKYFQSNFLSCFLLLLLASCKYFNSNNDEAALENPTVAEVGKEVLKQSEIIKILPKTYSKDDSIYIVNKYINTWIKNKLLLEAALDNIGDSIEGLQEKINNYKNSLLIHAYETAIIAQKLDTLVSQEMIESFYNDNKSNFELRDHIIKSIFVKLPKQAPDIKKFEKYFELKNDEDYVKLESYCYQFASKFSLDDRSWVIYEDLAKEIPLKTNDPEKYFNANKNLTFTDSLFVYYLKVKDFKSKSSVSPLSFEQNNIKNIIINQRKLQLINNLKQEIFEDAVKREKFIIYKKS